MGSALSCSGGEAGARGWALWPGCGRFPHFLDVLKAPLGRCLIQRLLLSSIAYVCVYTSTDIDVDVYVYACDYTYIPVYMFRLKAHPF